MTTKGSVELIRIDERRDDEHGLSVREAFYLIDGEREYSFRLAFSSYFEKYEQGGTDHWMILGVISSFVLQRRYVHPHPVSEELLRNMRCLVGELANFYSQLSPIRIEAEEAAPEPAVTVTTGEKVGCLLYSGGVDSIFTFEMNRSEITGLLTARFFATEEWELENIGSFEQTVHPTLGLEHITVSANFLRTIGEFADGWANLTHGAALCSLAHMFGGKYDQVLISSSYKFGALFPWGSHPLTDPLVASPGMSVKHFGNRYSRYEKINELVRRKATALNSLAVCGERPDIKGDKLNCSRCQKCQRTMVAFDLCDAKDLTREAFDWSLYDMQSLRDMYLYHHYEYVIFRDLRDAATARGRHDISEVMERILRRSRFYVPLSRMENHVRVKYPLFVARNTNTLKALKRRVLSLRPGGRKAGRPPEAEEPGA